MSEVFRVNEDRHRKWNIQPCPIIVHDKPGIRAISLYLKRLPTIREINSELDKRDYLMQADFANIRGKTPTALVALFFVLFIIMLPLFLAKISVAQHRQAG